MNENATKKRNENQNHPRPLTDVAIRALIARGMANALAKQEIQKNTNLNGDGSQGSGSGIMRPVRLTRECTYSDYLKCQPLNFKVTKGIVGLTQWFKRMKPVFHISNCVVENQVKFATCTLHGIALTMWNSHVKATNVERYTQRFQELALLCGRMFPEESDKVEKFVPMLRGTLKTRGNLITTTKLNNNFPRGRMAQAYAIGTGERKEYAGNLSLCNKCKFHHNGPCTAKCANCKKVGHLTRDCWNPTATSNQRTINCYECGKQGNYKSDYLELKNRNHGNQAEGTKARKMLYALGGGETNQDLDDMEDDINA
nr:hypothetical protein [Tanacetum cinerariifolium]